MDPPGPNWLGQKYYAMAAVIVVNIWRGLPFFAITILAGLVAIPKELYEAAEADGAGPVGALLVHHPAAAEARAGHRRSCSRPSSRSATSTSSTCSPTAGPSTPRTSSPPWPARSGSSPGGSARARPSRSTCSRCWSSWSRRSSGSCGSRPTDGASGGGRSARRSASHLRAGAVPDLRAVPLLSHDADVAEDRTGSSTTGTAVPLAHPPGADARALHQAALGDGVPHLDQEQPARHRSSPPRVSLVIGTIAAYALARLQVLRGGQLRDGDLRDLPGADLAAVPAARPGGELARARRLQVGAGA